MNFNEKITQIQNELKAPKNQYNSFGDYNYRNCEDILEAVKPLLLKYKLRQKISDCVVLIGQRYYVQAEVYVTDGENEDFAHGWAREDESRKKMHPSQLTGSASSYARKYALNGMWLIDDTKDADTDEHHKKTNGVKEKEWLDETDRERFIKVEEWVKAGNHPLKLRDKYKVSKANMKHFETLYIEAGH